MTDDDNTAIIRYVDADEGERSVAGSGCVPVAE